MSNQTLPWFLQRFTYPDGRPLSGGKLYFYVGGSTSLPKQVYTDHENVNPITQPLVLDASGVAPQYYCEDGLYKIVVQDSAGAMVATRDYIQPAGGSGTQTDDHKVMVDSFDTTPGYLSDKLLSGNGTTAVEVIGTQRTMKIDSKGYVAGSPIDAHIATLSEKLVSSPSVTIKTVNNGTQNDPNVVVTAEVNQSYNSIIPVWVILKDTDPAGAPSWLPQADLEFMHEHGYGAASSENQTTDPGPGDLSIWYLEGGTYWGNATWVERHYLVGQMILNANRGLYDYLHTHPLDTQTEGYYSNYPAGLYTLNNDNSDGYLWGIQVVNQYPDPEYDTDAVLTYNAFEKKFIWVANDNLAGDGAVKIDANDSPGFLGYKIQAGAGITVVDTPNDAYGRCLKINATGSNPSGRTYASTMYIANAVQTLAPNLIVRSELVTLFVPTTDIKVIQGVQSKFGCFLSQGGSGTMSFTVRDENYKLIAQSYDTTNPLPQVFLELNCGVVYDPATGLSVPNYTLNCGGRYYLGILWNANGIQLLGDDAVQLNNTQPYTAYKVDNLASSYALAQLTGGGESKQRPFIRLLTSV